MAILMENNYENIPLSVPKWLEISITEPQSNAIFLYGMQNQFWILWTAGAVLKTYLTTIPHIM